MKKLLITSAFTLSLVFLLSSFSKVQASTFEKSKLIGTWEQCDSLGNSVETGMGITKYKIITPETFTVIQGYKEKGIFGGIFFGSYLLENDIYTEILTYTDPQMLSIKGTKNLFYIVFDNDLMHINGINNPYKQVWKKVVKL